MWLFLRRVDWMERGCVHWLLWLLIPCLATAQKDGAPESLDLVLTVAGGAMAVMILAYCFHMAPARSFRALMSVIAWIMLVSGFLLMTLTLVGWALGMEPLEQTWRFLRPSGEVGPAHYVHNLEIGGVMLGLGIVLRLMFTIWGRRIRGSSEHDTGAHEV